MIPLTPTPTSQVETTPTPTPTSTTIPPQTCTASADFADGGVSSFSITINGLTYSFGDLWKSTVFSTPALYLQLESELNALTVGGLPLGQFTIEPDVIDNGVGIITVIGNNLYEDFTVTYNGNPIDRPFSCN